MEKYIPETNERYSISTEGIIYSNYRYLRNGKKNTRKKIISNYLSTQRHTSTLVDLFINNKYKTFLVNSLMVKLFKIKKPDKYHFYDVINKDGNVFNTDIKNIGFKIRMEKNNNYLFYPQPFYNKQGRITHKICGKCGNKKTIKHFHLQPIKENTNHVTYRNICETCRSQERWNTIKSDPNLYKNHRMQQLRWNYSEKGQSYLKQYRKKKHKKDYTSLSIHYIQNTLRFCNKYNGLNANDLTPELIKLTKKRILLYRKRKQLKLDNHD